MELVWKEEKEVRMPCYAFLLKYSSPWLKLSSKIGGKMNTLTVEEEIKLIREKGWVKYRLEELERGYYLLPNRYFKKIRNARKKAEVREEMIGFYYNFYESISLTAMVFGTTRKTVRKWLRRFKEKGRKGLWENSRRPKRSPKKPPRKWQGRCLK